MNEKTNHIIYSEVVFADGEWVRFEGSQERLYFGPEHGYSVGDKVKITIEKDPRS